MTRSSLPVRAVKVFRAALVAAFALAVASPALSATVRGRIVDSSGLPLPGVAVTLTRPDAAPVVVTTESDGTYTAEVPTDGQYGLKAELSGFDSISQTVSVVQDTIVLPDLTMKLARVEERVDVVASTGSVLGGSDASRPEAVNRNVIDNAQVPNNRFEDVLPLLPSVIRGRDGLISVAGARAPQGALLVNGVRETDPVTGQFASGVPLAAVENVEVSSTSASAEHGNAVGGITQVRTRAGDDKLRFSISSLAPRFRIADSGIEGVDGWEPNGGIRGPIVRGRAWFAQSFDYRYERAWFDTLAGRQPTRMHGVSSLTQVDTRLRDGHWLTALVSFYPQTTTHASLGAFTPAPTTPNFHTGGWSAIGIDRLTLGDRAVLESRFQVKTFDASVTPDNTDVYVVGHDIVSGGYFNVQRRNARRVAWDETYGRAFESRLGDHELKVGLSLSDVTFDGTSLSEPVRFLRSDGTLAVLTAFDGPGSEAASARHVGTFVQDAVNLSREVRLDLGVRFDADTLASGPRVTPRIGVSYAPGGGKTILSGTAGVYADQLVLGAAAFPLQQDRIVTRFDEAGIQPIEQTVFDNVIRGSLRAPYATAWTLQVDRELGDHWLARVKYQERHGSDELTVDPVALTATTGEMVLSSEGTSRSRSLETTVGRRIARLEMYVSYVRAATRGNLNDLNSIEGNFKLPLVQPDQIGPLAVDVPNRLLMWGIVKLPREVTVAPFFELRDGFPYSIVDENWTEIGQRNSARFPAFASLDIVASKIVRHLPFGLPPARIGIKLFNITGRFNPRDVQRDIERPDFGTVYNPIQRQLRGVFEFVWGEK